MATKISTKLENKTNGRYFEIGTDILPVFESPMHLWADSCEDIIKTNMKFILVISKFHTGSLKKEYCSQANSVCYLNAAKESWDLSVL